MLINRFLIWSILSFRPLLGPTGICRFELSCTDYAVIELSSSKNLIKSLWEITKRLLKCQPLCPKNNRL